MLAVVNPIENVVVAQTDRPNIIFILTDDMRFDFFSAAGHPYLETPNIDRLASEGTVFNRAYVATPLCGPNRASINTGLLASQHGIINHEVHKTPGLFYPDGNFLPAAIHNAVDRTAMIGKFFHTPNSLHRPEYDRWFVHNGIDGTFAQAYTNRIFNVNSRQRYISAAAEIAGSPTHYATDIEFHEAARWIHENRGQQFFQFVSPFAPHSPASPAVRHAQIYQGMQIPQRPSVAVSNSHLAEIAANYNKRCEMMLAVDEGIGVLFDQLESDNILENTVIVFTSDNGMMFGEHGRSFEKKVPFEEACRVPLLVRYGANVSGQGPIDANQLVSLADLMMTFAELAGGTIPAAMPGTRYYGRSLATEWLGDSGHADVRPRDDVVSLFYNNHRPDNIDELDNDGLVWASIVTDDGWKYVDINLEIGDDVTPAKYNQIVNNLEPMLFNLNQDPYEQENLFGNPDFRQIRNQLRHRLFRRLVDHDAEFRFGPDSSHSGVEYSTQLQKIVVEGSFQNDRVEAIDIDDERMSVSLIGAVAENEIHDIVDANQVFFRGLEGDDHFVNMTSIDATAYGHGGNDVLIGGEGHNRFQGGPGDDLLIGGDRNDFLRGRDGNDTIFGGHRHDRIFGGQGQDRIFGEKGRDRIDGGQGNDWLSGGRHKDRLIGGVGNDALYGGVGDRDRLDSGPGFDRFLTTNSQEILDISPDDAFIQFLNIGTPQESGFWTTNHVQQADNALLRITHRTRGRVKLIRDPVTNRPIRIVKRDNLHPNNQIIGQTRTLSIPDWSTTDAQAIEETRKILINQIARSWDSAVEINSVFPGNGFRIHRFQAISQWQAGNNPPPGFELSIDGQWYYRINSQFFDETARRNPSSDWATIWELVTDPNASLDELERLNEKVDEVQQFFDVAGQ